VNHRSETGTQHVSQKPMTLRLFVAGDGPNSREAVANLKAIRTRCAPSLDVEIEIIDVLQEPLRALEYGVFVTPTLTAFNTPVVSIVGTLADHGKVMRALGWEARGKGSGTTDTLGD